MTALPVELAAAFDPEVGLEEGLAATIDYYRANGDAYWGEG